MLARSLSDFEPTTQTLRPEEARDSLEKLYQYLVPKQLRHDLSEYYTPDWIAERLLNQLGYDGNPDTRLLDPACGSGTFLTLALARVREKMELELWDRDPRRREMRARKVLHSVVGFDLNPFAVIAGQLQRNPGSLNNLQGELDRLAAELWSLSDRELLAVIRETGESPASGA